MSEIFSHKILAVLSELDISEKTKETYERHIRAFLKFADMDMEKLYITKADVQAYVNHLQEAGRSAATVQAHLAAILRFAEAIGCGITGKILHTKPQKITQPKSLERKERLKLLREVEKAGNKRNTAIVYLLLFTGVRVSELCSLDIADIKISDRSGAVHVRQGKGNKERTVPMPHEAREALRAYLQERPLNASQPLFMTNRGTRISPRSVQALCADLGTNPHALRHTFCRMLVASGVDLVTVAALAGHANLQSTAIYAQPTESELSEAISRAFGG